ncbi:hypothetical protein BC828DRAFT_392403 [Blastocladiella britannica]|nr:hypothetical protein BC828DRAFT_392403 [Blastocladiella britannica]
MTNNSATMTTNQVLAALKDNVAALLALGSGASLSALPPLAHHAHSDSLPATGSHHEQQQHHHHPEPLSAARSTSASSLQGLCSHAPETRAALAAIYDAALDLVAELHPHVFTEAITPLGSPAPVPRLQRTSERASTAIIAAASSGADPVTPDSSFDVAADGMDPSALAALTTTVRDQRRLLAKARLDLQVEQGLSTVLRKENAAIKERLVMIAAATEQEEEALTNKFLVHIEDLQKEKARIIELVEREEEYITNTLQRKLAQLQREKIDMENQLEQEQEAIVNRLQKQLEALRASQTTPSGQGSDSGSTGSLSLGRRGSAHASMHDMTAAPLPPPMLDLLRAEVQGLKVRIHELERELNGKNERLRVWRDELLMARQAAGVPIQDLFEQ